MVPGRRSTTFYRAVLALPVVMAGYFLASGRAAAYWRLFAGASGQVPPGPDSIGGDMITAVLWLAAASPLMYAAWEIGREHTAARRRDYAVLVGLREVVRRAVRAPDAAAEMARSTDFARPPRDRPEVALLWGLLIAILVPTFFASFSPELRTPRGLLWLGITGLLMGTSAYARHRAMAYLRDEPGRWDFFREWRLLSAGRYEPAGRPFVRWQRLVMIALPIWWIGGGMYLMSR